MSLRAKLIEAGAEALDGMPAALLGAAAGVVLDAFLDVLAEEGVIVKWCDEHNAPQWRDDKCYTVLAIESRGSARFNTCRIVTRLVIDLEELTDV